MRLKDKVALITGAGSGIGREAALLFAREGGQRCRCGHGGCRRAGDRLADRGRGRQGALRPCRRLARAADVRAMVGAAEEGYGRLNVLFNNAGIFPAADGGVLETDEETWDLVMRVNLKGSRRLLSSSPPTNPPTSTAPH